MADKKKPVKKAAKKAVAKAKGKGKELPAFLQKKVKKY